jgi:hypothetical protein
MMAICKSFSSQRILSKVLRSLRYLNLQTTAQRYCKTCKSFIFVDSASVYFVCSFSIVENIKEYQSIITNYLSLKMETL